MRSWGRRVVRHPSWSLLMDLNAIQISQITGVDALILMLMSELSVVKRASQSLVRCCVYIVDPPTLWTASQNCGLWSTHMEFAISSRLITSAIR